MTQHRICWPGSQKPNIAAKSDTSHISGLTWAAPLLLVLIAPPAVAEGPMNTDDTGTLDKGGMKIEGVLSRDDKERGGELVFGFGPIENVEVGIAVARARDGSADPDTKLTGNSLPISMSVSGNSSRTVSFLTKC